MSTADTIALIAPEFSGDTRIDGMIDIAVDTGIVGVEPYGDRYGVAIAYLTAHMLTIADQGASSGGGSAGPIASKKAGDLAISYGSRDVSSQEALAETTYGRALIDIRSSLVATAPICIGVF